MAGFWPPAVRFFGLHVYLGDYHTKRAEWLQLPTAAFTCRWGCELVAVGAADVVELTRSIAATHARTCPGPPTKENPA